MKKKFLAIIVAGVCLSACEKNDGPGYSQPDDSATRADDPPEKNDPAKNLGDLEKGKAVLAEPMCSSCHVDDGDGNFSGKNEFHVDTMNADSVEALAKYIAQTMPVGETKNCIDDCANDSAAYLWSLKGGVTPPVSQDISCTSSDPVFYGKRSIKVLTSFEYHNSLQRLFTKPLPDDYSSNAKASADNNIARLPNHTTLEVDDQRLSLYDQNALELAQWAMSDDALPFDCRDIQTQACANKFIQEFAYPAYRRPLTADEKQQLSEIIVSGITEKKGLEWAIRTVISSPNFLYRFELGEKVQDVIDHGWGLPSVNNTDEGGTLFTIQAEDYNSESGTMTEETTDNGGGLNVGYIDTNDFLEYDVDIDYSGNYDITYRLASDTGGGRLTFEGQGSVDIDNTGGWQDWVSITDTVTLTQGAQTIRINATSGGFNINWFELAFTDEIPKSMQGAERDEPQKLSEAEGSAYILDPFEFAATLSYMYQASSPDDILLNAAATGKLSDDEEIERQIERMMDSELGQLQVKRFLSKWLKTDGVKGVSRDHPDFTDKVKESMAEELRSLYAHVFYDENTPFTDIYDGGYTMLDETLANFYGISGGGNGHLDFEKVPTSDRGGVIASGAFMAFNAHEDESAPIFRSVMLRQNMLCQEVPPPPTIGEAGADREINLKEAVRLEEAGELTTAEYYNLLTDAGDCHACHQAIINPLFGMDDFDHVGLTRDVVNGEVVQKGRGENGNEYIPIEWVKNGRLYGVNNISDATSEQNDKEGIHFSGALDLSFKLAKEPAVTACYVQRKFRFATGFPLNSRALSEGEAELTAAQNEHFNCVTKNLTETFTDSNLSPYELYKAIGLSDVIRYRKD